MSDVTVCVISPQPNNDRLAQMLSDKGVEVWQLPTLDFAPPSDNYLALDHAIDELSIYSVVVFTSTHAVVVFQQRLDHHGDAPIGHLKFAVVGESTAHLCAEYGFPVHYIPSVHTSRALGELLSLQSPPKSRILFPQAEEGREEFVQAIESADVELTVVPAYRTIPATIDVAAWQRRMTENAWQALVATSPRGLRAWLDAFGHAWAHEVMEKRTLFVMGATTEETARRLGFRNIRTPAHSTLESLCECIVGS